MRYRRTLPALIAALALFPAAPARGEAWQPTGGPEGGDVHALSVSGPVVFAGTYEGGVYRSDDLGGKWSATEANRSLGWVKDIGRLGRYLLAGTSQGFFRSEDEGVSWSRMMTSSAFPPVPQVEAFAAFRGVLIACVRQVGLVRSTDSGNSWTNINHLAPNASFLSVSRFHGDDSALYAGGPGVMKSLDDGLSWTDITGDMQSMTAGRPIVVYSLQTQGSALYAGIHGAVLRTLDGGTTWSTFAAFHPDNAVLALAQAGGRLFIGTNNDGLWSAHPDSSSPTRLPGWNFSIRTLLASDSGIFAGTGGGGVYHSRDGGGTWAAKRSGMRNQAVLSLLVRGGKLHAGCFLPGIFRSSDLGATWNQDSSGLEMAGTQALTWHGDRLFAGMRNRDGVHVSDDGGIAWKKIETGGRMDSSEVLCLVSLGGALYAGSTGLFRSDDQGQTWRPVAESELGRSFIFSLAAAETRLHVGSAGGYYRLEAASGEVTAAGLVSGGILSVYAEGRRVFAGVQRSGIWLSEDEGLTWAETGVKHPLVLAFAGNGAAVFAGTDGAGVFRSLDSGATWNAHNSGDLHRRVMSLALDGNRLYAGTHGGSVYRLDLEGPGRIPARPPLFPEKRFRVTAFPGLGIRVEFTEKLSGGGWFRINRGDGRRVAEHEVRGGAPGFPAPLEFRSLPSGSYLLRFQTARGEDARWVRILP